MPAQPQPWWQDLDTTPFHWHIPQQFNIATACLETADPEDLALVVATEDGHRETTFGQLRTETLRLARWMQQAGLERGDRVAVLLPQCRELVTMHLAAYAVGLVVVPLTVKFGPDAVRESVIAPDLIPAGIPWVDTTTVSPADADEFAAAVPTYVGVPVVGEVAWDPDAARWWSHGEPQRRFDRSALPRSVVALGESLRALAQRTEDALPRTSAGAER